MGLLVDLLLLPVMGPLKGVMWVAEIIREQAEDEFYGEDAVRGALMELEMRFDLGEIPEDEFNAAEEELLQRLRVIRERNKNEEE
jgi:hypothetical protein